MSKFQLPDFGAGLSRADQPTTRQLLEETKLSKLPQLPRRNACANCGGSLDATDEFQTKVKLCRACLKSYANCGVILEKYSEQKIRQIYREEK